MIKTFTIAKRLPHLSQDEYLRYLKEKHGPLASRVIPGVRKYVQNHPVIVPGFEFEIDSISQMWWDDLDSLQNYFKWRQTEEAKVLLDDELKFSNPIGKLRFFGIEHVFLER